MKMRILFLLFVPSLSLAEPVKQEVILNGQKVTVEIVNNSTDVRLLKGKNKIGEWKNRSIRTDTGKTVSVIKLSTKEDTEYLLLYEEPAMYSYASWIVGINQQGKAEQIYSGPARGKLEDYDQDGLLDFLKSGGHGEPTSDENGSYDPYLVYKQKRDTKSIEFEIDEELSKKFSQLNGYAWHGKMYNEQITVNQKTGKLVK